MTLIAVTALSLAPTRALPGDYAVVVHEDNPQKSLSKAALIRIFRADNQYWDASGGRIQLLLPKAGSREKMILLREVYGMTDDELKRYWTELVFRNTINEAPRVLPSNAVLLSVLARSKSGIAIVDAASLDPKLPVSVVLIDGKKPGSDGYFLHEPEKKIGKGDSPPEARASEKAVQSDQPSGIRTTNESMPSEPSSKPMEAGAGARDQEAEDLTRRVQELEHMVGELQAGPGTAEEGINFDLGPRFHLRGFSDITFEASSTDTDGPTETESTNNFALGGLDLFITSQLSDKVSFLNENVFETNSENETSVDVERLILKYDWGNGWNVQGGRFHTTLGYWNTAFHHGQWTQTSVGRPRIVSFEDDNGILPVHTIGLAVNKQQETSFAGLNYTLEMGNGRGPTPDPPQTASDANDSKMINLAFGVRPHGLPGFSVGANILFDTIPSNSDAGAGTVHASTDERILGLFVAYRGPQWNVISEVYDVHHEESGLSDADSNGGLLEVSRKFGDWTPYVRFDWTDLGDGDTYFANADNQSTIATGVRWDLDTWVAMKLQLSHTEVNAASGGSDQEIEALAFQTAFAF